jgi:hypothetical protein
VSWIGVGVLKTDVEETENLLIEETPIRKSDGSASSR